MKRIIKIAIRIFIGIIIFIDVLVFIFIYITELRITDVSEYINKENGYKVIFQAVGTPKWPFGETKVRVTVVNSRNKKIEQFQEEIGDDGASARESNIEIKWYENYVEVILKGGEQEDSIHTIKY